MTADLQLHNLTCDKGTRRLFRDISCTLSAGELLHVAGENGSGKTTLLRMLAGLQRDYHGDIFWQGSKIRQHWPEYAQNLLYLGHQPALKARLTARENLLWYAHCAGENVGINSLDNALSALGIRKQADLPCHQLSAGQQRRTVLARLFFSTQKLWLLDEPFTAIDSHGIAPIVDCLRKHLARSGMIIMTTHHGMESIALPHRTLTLSATSHEISA